MKSVLVIGLGEVGRPLLEIARESRKFDVFGWDIDESKMLEVENRDPPSKVHIMHICIRCDKQQEFTKATVGYMKRFKPDLTIINSTIPPTTTEEVCLQSRRPVVHSPVRGMHFGKRGMKDYLLSLTKFVAGADPEAVKLASDHFSDLGIRTKTTKKAIETELAKLFETTYRALMIAWFQEMHRISRQFSARFDAVVDFLEDTHRERLDRPIMFPGLIGGHCLVPNAKLLLRSYDSELVRMILKSNKKRAEELRDTNLSLEIERLKERAERLQRELMQQLKQH